MLAYFKDCSKTQKYTYSVAENLNLLKLPSGRAFFFSKILSWYRKWF